MIDTIEKTNATFVPGVPTFYNALLNHPKVKAGEADLTSIKLCISGASALLQDTKERFEALTGARIVEGYALTESMMAIVCTPVDGAYKVGSIGDGEWLETLPKGLETEVGERGGRLSMGQRQLVALMRVLVQDRSRCCCCRQWSSQHRRLKARQPGRDKVGRRRAQRNALAAAEKPTVHDSYRHEK